MMKSNLEKRRHWQSVVEDWQQSGLTQKKYCLSKDISFSTFKNWLYRSQHLAKSKKLAAKQSDFVPVKIKPCKTTELHSKDVHSQFPAVSGQDFKILFPSGISVVISSRFDESSLLRLMAILHRR